jgi:alkylhydroperoxidase family enzyme
MSERMNRLRGAAIARALRGPGHADPEARLAAFANADVDERARALIDKVARNAWKVTDEDVDAAKRAGLSEDEIFELVVCAAFGQSSRQLTSALAALDAAAGAREGERS